MNGVYFALRSGSKHRQLRSEPCQIQVIEVEGQRSYLKYTEDISKNRPGGLKGRKLKPKVVSHYNNPENPEDASFGYSSFTNSSCQKIVLKIHFTFEP